MHRILESIDVDKLLSRSDFIKVVLVVSHRWPCACIVSLFHLLTVTLVGWGHTQIL